MIMGSLNATVPPTEPSARPRRCARYPTALPTWISPGSGGGPRRGRDS
jgi:hypothetical protein